MPELHYRDTNPAMFGRAVTTPFANAVAQLQALRLRQQEQAREEYWKGQQVGMERERLNMEKPYYEAGVKERQVLANRGEQELGARSQFADAMTGAQRIQQSVPGGVGPMTEQNQQQLQQYLQNIMRAQAFLGAGNDASMARRLEPQQFSPGQAVYGPMTGVPGGPTQPIFTTPPALPGPAQNQHAREFVQRMIQQRAARAVAEARMNRGQTERERHDRAIESKGGNAWDRETQGATGTNQPTVGNVMTATNPRTKQRIVSRDGGKTWELAQ